MEVDGQKLRLAIAGKCMSMKEAAKAAGLSEATVVKMVNGRIKPNTKTVGKVCQALGLDVKEIIKA